MPENVHSLSLSVAGVDFMQFDHDIMGWHTNLPPADGAVKTEFLPDCEGHIISGKIVDVSTGEPLKDGRVFPLLGFVGDQIRLFGGLTNKTSDVQFVTKRIKGVHELATTTFSSSDNKYRIDIQSPFAQHAEKKLPEFVLNQSWEEQLLRRSIGLQVQYAYVIDSMNKVDTTYAHFQWKPDRSYILDEYTRFTTMEEVVIEFIPSLSFRRLNNKRFLSVLLNENNTFSLGNSLVMIDGIPIMDHETVFRYDPLLVYKIDVYKDKFVFGNIHFEGLVFITTYKQDYPTLKTDETTHIFDYEGTQAHRYFYLPSYTDDSVRNNRIPDYRHTLLWMPEVYTNGKPALSVPFSTSDLTGDFQITVEGLTKDGKVIRGVSFFNVGDTK